MKWFSKLFSAVKTFVQARYEAAIVTWGERRWLNAAYQDARFEVDFGQSMEICRKHLDFCANNTLVQRIRNLKIQFAVGVDGLKVIPNASDSIMSKDEIEQWNEARADKWEQWCRFPELGSNLSMAELTIQWEGMLFDVGNIIIHKTRDEFNRPKIQTIDRLRLQTPPEMSKEEGKTIIQGIELAKMMVQTVQRKNGKNVTIEKEIILGKPAFFWIRDEFDLQVFTRIPASDIIHKFRAIRPGMCVGIPEAFSAIPVLHDWTDLCILEMQAAKIACEIAVVETNATGELDPQFMRRQGANIQTTNATGAAITKRTGVDYNVSFGAKKFGLKQGDTLKNFMVERPSPATQDYWDLLITQICIGYNVPKLLVVPYSLQGTVTRADLSVCATAFRADFEIIACVLREIYEWQLSWSIKFDKGMDGKVPEKYRNCVVRPPRSPDVDIGYSAAALQIEVEMGLKSYQDICAERNIDWRQNMRENAEAQAFKNKLAEEFDIDPNSISFTQFKSGPMQAAADAKEEQSDKVEIKQAAKVAE